MINLTTTYDKVKEWRKKNPEKHREQSKKWAKEHPEYRKNYAKNHILEHNLGNKRYRENHKEEIKLKRKENYDTIYRKSRENFLKIKMWCIEQLGNKCKKCNIKDLDHPEIYDFHHINGRNDEEKNKITRSLMVKWYKNNKIPNDVELLCSNCHRVITAQEEREHKNNFN